MPTNADLIHEAMATLEHVARNLKTANDLRDKLVAEGRTTDAGIVDWMIATIRTAVEKRRG